MHYKTLCLQLIQERPQLYGQLRKQRTLLPTLERYAQDLKERHDLWKDQLAQARPGSDPSQIASEALEIALKELEDSLPPASPPAEDEPLSLDAAMAFIRRPTPPA